MDFEGFYHATQIVAEHVHVLSASFKLYKTSIFKVVKFPSILTLKTLSETNFQHSNFGSILISEQ